MAKTEVLIIGGGVMGCATALALARRGAAATVLEKSVPGAEASSAAAGILGAQLEAHGDGPMTRLCIESRARYAAWVAGLEEATRIDVGYRRCGVSRVAYGEEDLAKLVHEATWQREAGFTVEVLGRESAHAAEPALAAEVAGGVRFAEDARVDPPSLLKALRIAAERAGARFQSGAMVKKGGGDHGRARGAALDDGTVLEADATVLAAGSWSSLVEGAPLAADDVRPARGQIVELLLAAPPLHGVVFGPGCYLVPRDDGRVLVGSTLELVGFRRGVTASAIRDLLTAAIRLVPALAAADLGRSWSSFRPYTKDGLPLLGATPVERLVLATGHYRNGILLAPITAEIAAAAALGQPSPFDAAPFSATRLG